MIESVLTLYADKFKRLYGSKIPEGELKRTLGSQVIISGDTFEIALNLESYYIWLENGREAGKFPPIDKILSWVERNNILPQPYQLPSGKVVFPSQKDIAFLIARKISEEGTEGKHYLEETIEELRDNFIRDITTAVKDEIKTELLNQFTNG